MCPTTAVSRRLKQAEQADVLLQDLTPFAFAFLTTMTPFVTILRQEGRAVGRRHVATLMRRMGFEALYCKPRLSQRHPAHTIYPYLLRDLTIRRPNHVWAADSTYILMARGYVYLFAVLDWASRRVLAWRLSTTLTTDFSLDAVQDAVGRYGPPAI